MPSAAETKRAYLLLLAMPAFFSSNLVLGRAAVEVVEPWTLAFWRWALAFLILLPFAARDFRAHAGTLLRAIPILLVLGTLGMWICGAIVYLSLKDTSATNATLIYTTSPIFIILIEMAFRGRAARFREIIGIVLSVIGVGVIVLKADPEALIAMRFSLGDIGILVCAVCWAVYSVLLRRPELQSVPTPTLFAAIAFAGVVTLFPFMLWETAVLGGVPATASAWTSIVALAIFPSVLAFGLFQYGVKIVGPAVTGIFMYLMPPYGVALAVMLLGETLHGYHIAGMILVTIGVAVATLPAALLERFSLFRRSRPAPALASQTTPDPTQSQKNAP